MSATENIAPTTQATPKAKAPKAPTKKQLLAPLVAQAKRQRFEFEKLMDLVNALPESVNNLELEEATKPYTNVSGFLLRKWAKEYALSKKA